MKFNMTATYQKPVSIARGKSRIETCSKEVTIDIKEMTAETFPVAYTVDMVKRDGMNSKDAKVSFVLHTDDGQIFSKYYDPYTPSYNDFICQPKAVKGGFDIVDIVLPFAELCHKGFYRTEPQVDELVKAVEDNVRIYDGFFWFRTEEPCYLLSPYVCPDSDFLLGLDIVGRTARLLEGEETLSIYRSDERDILVKRLGELITDCPSSMSTDVNEQVKRAMERLEGMTIANNNGPHLISTYEERRDAFLRKRVAKYICENLSDKLLGADEIREFVTKNAFRRIRDEKGNWDDRNISDAKLEEAMKDSFHELVSVWHGVAESHITPAVNKPAENGVTILITERNVDGCGSDVEVGIRVDKKPNEDDYAKLRDELAKQKSRCVEEWLDTDEMIARACDVAFGKDCWQFIGYDKLISF